MFNYIYGEIVDFGNSTVVVDVNGVGFELSVSGFTMADCQIGQKQRLYTYMQVKEDDISLFGFSTLEEKKMFLLLISVSGIGCKVAQAILSGMDSNSLALAIFNGDTRLLTKIKGLGKKTAERLVLELKEKVVVDAVEMVLPITQNPDLQINKDMQNAIAVLVSLGKSQADAEKLVDAAAKLGATTTEELINMAFRIN
ncbi:MAG: Holliday junction branch migration protein RuvA [Clostridiales bacterium]|nr:Holliday junction branch migration protein RuvA [Clostridiales bacterium]